MKVNAVRVKVPVQRQKIPKRVPAAGLEDDVVAVWL
jgi:hypothetical protein